VLTPASPARLLHEAPVAQQQQLQQQDAALLSETLAAALRAGLAGSVTAAVAPAQAMDLDVAPSGYSTGPAALAQVPRALQNTAAPGSTFIDILSALRANIGDLATAGAASGQLPAAPGGTCSPQAGQLREQGLQEGAKGGQQGGLHGAQGGATGVDAGALPAQSGPAGVASAQGLAEILSMLVSVPRSSNVGQEQ
jgi:hypothetical protein